MKISYDADGTPGIWADNLVQAYRGLGWTHGRHRPLQALILGAAGRGTLSRYVLPREDLVRLDALVLQLDLPARGAAAENQLGADDAVLLNAYLAGFAQGLRFGGQPWELRLLLTRLPPLTVASTLSSLMLSAYLGLSEGQERMERGLLHCLSGGADAALLERMFAPHLSGWDPQMLRGIDDQSVTGSVLPPLASVGGSNAWAITPQRSASGHAMLCGDPHLQVNQLPALFFEVRARVARDYWLGASIPGLPGIAVGRNRNVAWSGTFSVADNVDFAVETVEGGQVQRGDGWMAPATRHATLRRRGRADLELGFCSTERGVLLSTSQARKRVLSKRWAAVHAPAEALAAYMHLPTATSAADAQRILERAHTLSLHFVLADRSGDVRYKQVGSIPRRSAGWSGLYPVDANDARRWEGLYYGGALPHTDAEDGMIVSANEARLAPDGGVLSTLAQPPYRMQRIEALLRARSDHDVASMQRIQHDVLCEQGLSLRPMLAAALPEGAVRQALLAWDGTCDVHSVGAHAYAQAYAAALQGLAPHLGGDTWRALLQRTEASVWYAAALDRLLRDPATWRDAALAPSLHAGLARCAKAEVAPWGQVQTLELKHMVLGDLPRWCGLNRGPMGLPGNVTTVSQGNLVPAGTGSIAVAPAYRMVCDLGDDALYTSMPGGIDGSAFAPSYTRWLDAWRDGTYHRVAPPDPAEVVGAHLEEKGTS